tara:strand:- start:56 stop:280 length:225 start_codon:yes stop_codon:yes gene_type:complete
MEQDGLVVVVEAALLTVVLAVLVIHHLQYPHKDMLVEMELHIVLAEAEAVEVAQLLLVLMLPQELVGVLEVQVN